MYACYFLIYFSIRITNQIKQLIIPPKKPTCMKNKIHKTFTAIVLVAGFTAIYSCDPPRECTDANCLYSDVGTTIEGKLTGNTNAVIHLGDTLQFSTKIPDTLTTNYGDIVFGQLRTNSFFGITLQSFDSIVNGHEMAGSKIYTLTPDIYGTMPGGTKTWNYTTRKYHCTIVPQKKGKYILNILGGRIEMTASNGKSWLINPSIIPVVDLHHSLYVSWFPTLNQSQASSEIEATSFMYCFEVN